ncbi:MAG TPA: Hsp20/alpha crystallin family protein [Spirochaetota bacterium]|nr:Hsp20/alpha crystallin family protein [Spirochaetota bacterium]
MNTELENVKNSERGNGQFFIAPRADIIEADGEYVIIADVPGLKKENVDITIDNGVLELRGRTVDENEAKGVFSREFRLPDYYRKFSLSDDISTTAITAKIDNGVLTLVLPKKEEVKPRKIEVLTN